MTGFRRAFLALLLLSPVALQTGTAAAAAVIHRVNGTVTDDNFAALEGFLSDSVDSIVGLKVSFEDGSGSRDGQVQAYVDGEMFVTYKPGPDMETEIVATQGHSLQHGFHVFDGFFLVKYGGMNQGISSLSLQAVDEAQILLSGARVEDVEIDVLDPAIVKR
ncbi:hypothetical protein [Breoghania sp. L-A4]|uniref:hypothetical protein n=1 Tax=Breoghania sp. L-A4 TaxID=2304600 RepID=UPI000E3599E9|nr:hypothetical protein [Breoghania sp. L-A4]AXS42284.1 hypothetical protein D1F64_22720 [Breoghania sp. L-A4]